MYNCRQNKGIQLHIHALQALLLVPFQAVCLSTKLNIMFIAGLGLRKLLYAVLHKVTNE